MRYLAATMLAVAVLSGAGLPGVGPAAEGQAHAAAAAAPVPVVPPPGPATLGQDAAGTWTTDLYLDTAALCGDTFDLVTGAPATGTRATTVTYDGSATAPCGAGQDGAGQDGAVTKVEATFPALPDGAVPLNATLVVTPSAAALGAGADPVEVALTVRRDVSAAQYLWIPVGCGVGLALLLIVLTMLIGVRRPDGETAHTHRSKFWRMPLYASSAWTFGDSWVTNITAVGTLIGTVLTASSSVASLLPGVDPPRFSLLLVMAGGFAVIAPVIFGLLNYRFGRQNPQGAGIVAIRLPRQNGDVTVRMDVGGSVAVPGGAALDGDRTLNPGTTLDIPVGTVVAMSAGEAGTDAGEILVLQASNEIMVPPALRVTLTPAVIVPSSAVQAAPAAQPAEPARGARGAGAADAGWASRLMALVRPDEAKTATDTTADTTADAAAHPPPALATVSSLTASEGATLTFVGRAEVTLPEGATVGAVGETVRPMGAPVPGENPAGPPPDPHSVPLADSQTFILPFAGEVVSQMSSMLLASCFTMFGIGANLGIVGWAIGYDLSAAPQWAHISVVTVSALAAVIVALYGVFAIRALADSRDGSVLSGRRGAAFIL
jgi:hypothetical protein